MSTMTPTAEKPDVKSAVGRKPFLRRVLGSQPTGSLFSVPYVVYVLVIFAYPFAYAIWMAFHDWFFAAPGVEVDRPFVGLRNFADLLVDPQVHRAFVNVGIFLIINVPLTVIIAMPLATLLNAKLRFRGFFRSAYYLPYITSSVALVGVWLLLFGSDGLVNNVLGPLAPDPSWLSNSFFAMPLIAVYVTWKSLGFFIVLYLAGLQGIGPEQYEAASVDGAGRFRTFFSITVPSLRSVTSLVVMLSIITGANVFTEPYLLTGGGGPNGASMTPALLMYQQGIEQNLPGLASALGLILIILVLVAALVSRRLIERD
jgi:multiple sugar transport system permease protein